MTTKTKIVKVEYDHGIKTTIVIFKELELTQNLWAGVIEKSNTYVREDWMVYSHNFKQCIIIG